MISAVVCVYVYWTTINFEMALSMDQAMQLLDFSSGKLDVQLLDSVVCRFYEGNGPEVKKYKFPYSGYL